LSEILDNKPREQGATARAIDERSARQVETRERAADLLRQIGLQLSPQTRTAIVDLHPRELGRIHIRMSVEGGRVRASLRAERPEALEALERHLPELRAELSRAGLDPQELSLSLGFEGRRGDDHAGAGRQARAAAPEADLRAATTDELAFVARRVARDGGVDTFA
jgi:flagellar hook-length control protein FliK